MKSSKDQPTRDVIEIDQLKLETKIGVLAWEREISQTLMVNISFPVTSQTVFESDDLSDAVNYVHVVEHLRAFAKTHSFQLLEAFAHHAAISLRDAFKLKEITLSIKKPALLSGVAAIGVKVTR